MTHRPRLVSSQDGTTHAGRFCWNLSIRRSGPGDFVVKYFEWTICGKKQLDWLIFVEGIGGSYYVSTMELMVIFCIFSLKPFC
jgi:hypothetical protein